MTTAFIVLLLLTPIGLVVAIIYGMLRHNKTVKNKEVPGKTIEPKKDETKKPIPWIWIVATIALMAVAYFFWPTSVPGEWYAGLWGLEPSDQWYPWAVQYLPMALIAWGAYDLHETKGSQMTPFRWVLLLLLMAVMSLALLDRVTEKEGGGKKKVVVNGEPITLDLRRSGVGGKVRITATPEDSILLLMPIRSPGDRNSHWDCISVIEPKILRGSKFEPLAEHTGWRTYRLSNETREKVRDAGTRLIVYEGYTIATPPGQTDPCPKE